MYELSNMNCVVHIELNALTFLLKSGIAQVSGKIHADNT